MALGAVRGRVVAMVLRDSLAPVLIGTGVGGAESSVLGTFPWSLSRPFAIRWRGAQP